MSTRNQTQAPPSTPAYWREALAGLPDEIEAPGLRRARAAPDDPGSPASPAEPLITEVRLDPAIRAGLAGLAAGHGGDLVTSLGAAVALLLTKLGAGTELPLGAVLTRGDLTVLRISVSESAGFRAVAASVSAAEQAAARHADSSYEEIEQAVNDARATPGRPLFRVGVARSESAASAAVRRLGHQSVWFAFSGTDTAGGPARIVLMHPATLLDATSARLWCDRLAHLLSSAVSEPDEPIRSISPLLPGETADLLGRGMVRARCQPVAG
jgi:non-ribosomal peptide synthetase component F